MDLQGLVGYAYVPWVQQCWNALPLHLYISIFSIGAICQWKITNCCRVLPSNFGGHFAFGKNICSFIYAHTHICIYIYKFAYIHAYIRTYVHTYIHTLHTYIHTYIHTRTVLVYLCARWHSIPVCCCLHLFLTLGISIRKRFFCSYHFVFLWCWSKCHGLKNRIVKSPKHAK